MLKFNRTTEYGLMALSYIKSKPTGEVSSAREISDHFALPFEILAKTLQRLKECGIIGASYGTRGGYVLAKDLNKINLTEFVTLMEGPISIVACATTTTQPIHDGKVVEKNADANHGCDCAYLSHCNIKPTMSVLNDKLNQFLNAISIEELTRASLENNRLTNFSTEQPLAYQTLQHGEEP